MISLHLIPMDKEGNLLPSEKWNRNGLHEWRGEDGRGFYSVASALHWLKVKEDAYREPRLDRTAKVPAGNTLAAVVSICDILYAAIVGHFDDPADSTDYFEDAPIVAQDSPEGQEEGK